MEIAAGRPEWDEVEDRDLLAQFLNTRTGRRLLPKLLENTPVLLASGQTNDILIRSGEVRGVQFVAQTLISLSIPEPKGPAMTQVNEEYPPLDADEVWKDGQRVKKA